jgi:diguanylate cyclase (GGDEF)-like protein/PAS domain S-box-containing protein
VTLRTRSATQDEAAWARSSRAHDDAEQGFDDLARLASLLCDTPMATISLTAEDRAWYQVDLAAAAPPGRWEEAICPEALRSDEPLVVPDATADPRTAQLPCVAGPPHVRFYAAVPITVTGGRRLGTLGVADDRPRHLRDEQVEGLVTLARQVVRQLERRSDSERIRVVGERWIEAETSLVAQERVIQDLEERFRLAFDEAPIGMALVDLRPGAVGQLLQVNRALARFLGYREEELKGSFHQALTHPDDLGSNLTLTMEMVAGTRDHYEMEKRYVHQDGTIRWAALHSSVLRDPNEVLVCALNQVLDLTARHRYEEELNRTASTDTLTGLPNRYALLQMLNETIQDQRAASIVLLVIDLDSFKLVNNAAGHLAGDRVLRAVGARFRELVGAEGTVARIGGDEFAVLCQDMTSEAATDLAEALIASLAEPISAAGQEMYLAASVGVAWTARADARAGAVLENADSAMYEAKRRGRGRSELFDGRLRSAATLRLRRASGLRSALQGEQLEMHFQPIVDLRTGSVVAAEALLRWNHPDDGMIWPADFISLAEEGGSIVAIGRWALMVACAEAVKWGDDGPSVSVNVSARQLTDDDVTDAVKEALARSGLSPQRLILEVTETAVMDDAEHAVRVLRQLKSLGVGIAVDDFGTGYSSLVYLKRLPVDKLKIDRSFVDGLPDDVEDAAIVAGVMALARAVGLEVVAEGVETTAQWEALRALGCDRGQGYLWGQPVPAAEATARFARAPGAPIPGTAAAGTPAPSTPAPSTPAPGTISR